MKSVEIDEVPRTALCGFCGCARLLHDDLPEGQLGEDSGLPYGRCRGIVPVPACLRSRLGGLRERNCTCSEFELCGGPEGDDPIKALGVLRPPPVMVEQYWRMRRIVGRWWSSERRKAQ